MKSIFAGAVLGIVLSGSATAALDTAKIDEITGLKGKLNPKEGVYKVHFPRSDVTVVIDGWPMPPFMGLGTWAGFTGANERALMMGDTVLFEDEVNPVMSVALDQGLSVTALHNHFFFDQPKVYFMHIGGEGPAEKLATGVRGVLDRVKQVRSAQPQPADGFGAQPLPGSSSLAGAPLGQILGAKPAE